MGLHRHSGPTPDDDADTGPGVRSWRRICGIETEYAVLYQPDEATDASAPPFSLIETVLLNTLLENRKAARSLGLKGGYFLENGGLAHFELFLNEQEDTPILELSTPECSNPRDLLRYQRAYDELLASLSDRSWRTLVGMGHHGRIAFGKNNLDSKSIGYGCHENYLVSSELGRYEKVLIALACPVLLALSTPWLLLFLVLFSAFLAALTGYMLASLLVRFFRMMHPEAARAAVKASRRLVKRVPRRLLNLLRRSYLIATNVSLWPVIVGFTTLLRAVACRDHVANLTGFLVTRQILCGAGWLNPATGRFELSQRAFLTTSLAKIIVAGRRKTMYDLKGFLYSPLSLFRKRRKLTICLGDSNLSDTPNLLKIGAMILLLDMTEDGEDFTDLLPAHPVATFRAVSAGGPWKNIRLRDGREITPVDIQRTYLARARAYVDRHHPEDRDRREILKLWEEMLERLANEPATLSGHLDWSAKKSLLDRAVLSRTNWKAFSRWSLILHAMGDDAISQTASSSVSLETIVIGLPWMRRRRVRKELDEADMNPHDFPDMLELYLQCRKIDLRFHEISCDAGYQRQLESEELIGRLESDEEVQRAISEPPPDTRARTRSYYINLNTSLSRKSVQAGWDRVVIVQSGRAISLADPFDYRIPTD